MQRQVADFLQLKLVQSMTEFGVLLQGSVQLTKNLLVTLEVNAVKLQNNGQIVSQNLVYISWRSVTLYTQNELFEPDWQQVTC